VRHLRGGLLKNKVENEMDFTQHLPLISLIVLPLCGFLYKQLTKLSQESVEQEAGIEGLKLYTANLDKAMARRSELEVLTTRIEALAHRLERTEDVVDRLRNGRQ